MKIETEEVGKERFVICAYMSDSEISANDGTFEVKSPDGLYAYIAQDIDYNGLNRVPLHKKWERVSIRGISWAPFLQNVEG